MAKKKKTTPEQSETAPVETAQAETAQAETVNFELDGTNFVDEIFTDAETRVEAVEDLAAKAAAELGEAFDFDDSDADEEISMESLPADSQLSEDTELAAFESAEVEHIEEVSEATIASVVESMLFATDKPQSIAMLKSAFQGTKVRAADIRKALDRLQMEYASPLRGVTLEEVAGGYQLRTKIDNQKFLYRTVKQRPFRLSGPALEVLSIIAYKQPCTKSMVDEVRGVESGHLMRGLLDRSLIHFAGKSELPGRPMYYETTRRFLETFGLRNINELPTLNEIDQLIPEGIGETVEEKQTLSDLTGQLSTEVAAKTYSEGEDELIDISGELKAIQTTTDFFEDEKRRQREKRDADRAQDIQERLAVGEAVEEKDKRWLARYELEQAAKNAAATATPVEAATVGAPAEVVPTETPVANAADVTAPESPTAEPV